VVWIAGSVGVVFGIFTTMSSSEVQIDYCVFFWLCLGEVDCVIMLINIKNTELLQIHVVFITKSSFCI